MTELCSIDVVTTASPGRNSPRRAMLIAWVALRVKITRKGSDALNSSATHSRNSYTTRPAAIDSR